MTNDERDELLVRMDERIKDLQAAWVDHKDHHKQSYYAFLGAGITAALALAGTLFNLFMDHIIRKGP